VDSARPKTSFWSLINLWIVGFVVVFLLLPILIVIPSAFNTDATVTFPIHGFTFKWFANAISREEFIRSFFLSVAVSVIATLISLVAGGLAAYAMVRRAFHGRALLELVLLSPLIFPSIVLAIALTMVLGSMGLLRTFVGLVVAHTIVTLPYAVRAMVGTFHSIDPGLEEAAGVLGARRWFVWRAVLLPLLRPGLLAAGIFSLIMSFDEFAVSYFVVGPGMTTLPIELFNYTEFYPDPTICAVSTILIFLSALAVLAIERSVGLARLMS
jgi:putative spermidine/putrescine transport system permease protein